MTLPDAESTFLTFGFQPVSAKVEFITGPITISTATVGSPPDRYNLAVAGFYQSLRVHDVTINGTPLDVGDNCRTARPFPVRLNGDFPDYTNVIIGGPLRGTVTIPEFTGCGTGGEDLDQLFTASLSGPDNLIAMNQGRLCVPSGGGVNGCPPVVPAPRPGARKGSLTRHDLPVPRGPAPPGRAAPHGRHPHYAPEDKVYAACCHRMTNHSVRPESAGHSHCPGPARERSVRAPGALPPHSARVLPHVCANSWTGR
ncbi:hypothetical protein ACFQ60_40165 [Streptomyces zhihengii]